MGRFWRWSSDMGSIQNNAGNEWFIDYGIDYVEPQAADFLWAPTQLADYAANVSCAIVTTDPQKKEEGCKESPCLKKRNRAESCAQPGTKACREKMRRDRLNDRFSELSSILDPERPPGDKVAILIDATCRLKQLNHEAQMLTESNRALQENIKKLKEEKMELRDKKARLKVMKEQVEQALKGLSGPTPFPPYPAMFPVTFSKTSTYPTYPPVQMWQWLPPAAMDTSQDHVLRPPVA